MLHPLIFFCGLWKSWSKHASLRPATSSYGVPGKLCSSGVQQRSINRIMPWPKATLGRNGLFWLPFQRARSLSIMMGMVGQQRKCGAGAWNWLITWQGSPYSSPYPNISVRDEDSESGHDIKAHHLIRSSCWRHHILQIQDTEKSGWNWKLLPCCCGFTVLEDTRLSARRKSWLLVFLSCGPCVVPHSLSRQNASIDTVVAWLFGVTNHVLCGFEALTWPKVYSCGSHWPFNRGIYYWCFAKWTLLKCFLNIYVYTPGLV